MSTHLGSSAQPMSRAGAWRAGNGPVRSLPGTALAHPGRNGEECRNGEEYVIRSAGIWKSTAVANFWFSLPCKVVFLLFKGPILGKIKIFLTVGHDI